MRAHYNFLFTGITLLTAAQGLRAQDTVIVPCNDSVMVETYCYVNNDDQTWHWQNECPNVPVFLQFSSGTIAAGDYVVLYDGPAQYSPVLFTNPLDMGMDMTGLQLISTGTDIYMEVTSNDVNCCATGGLLGGGQSEMVWSVTGGSSTTGIHQEQASNCTMYPNPASSELHVRLSSNPSGSAEIRILDVTGRVVYQNSFVATGEELNTFDVHGLQSGTYSVVVSTAIGVKTQKLQIVR
ncbi:MAG: T9SS type A sorting domain-containing protein [Flavobacteriales bacterium]